MPPVGVTPAERQAAISQLAAALLPLVKNDVSKANSYALQVESKIYEATPTKDVWVSKVQSKLKGVQQKVAQQQGPAAAAPVQPAAMQQPLPAQQQQRSQPMVVPPQQQQQATYHMQLAAQQHAQAVSAFAQQQAQQQAQLQAQQQQAHLKAQQAAHQRVELQKMPTFTDPAFQQMAKAFLETDDNSTAQGPAAAVHGHAAAAQQQRLQAAQQAQQHQQQQAVAALHVRQQQALQAQAAGPFGQAQMVMQQPPSAYQQQAQAALAQQQQQQQQQVLLMRHQAAAAQQGGMLGAAMQPPQQAMAGPGMQAAAAQVTHAQAAAAAAQAAVPAELAQAQPLVAKYMEFQNYARVHLMEDAKEMLRYFSSTPDPQGAMQRRVQNLAATLSKIEEKEPHLRVVIDQTQVHIIHETVKRLQKDVQKFRQYMANHKDKMAREQSSAGGPSGGSLPSLHGFSQGVPPATAGAGVYSQGYSLQPQPAQPWPKDPVLFHQHVLQHLGLPPGPGLSPATGRGGLPEIMDESQPNYRSTTPAMATPPDARRGGGTPQQLVRAGSSSMPPSARPAVPPTAAGARVASGALASGSVGGPGDSARPAAAAGRGSGAPPPGQLASRESGSLLPLDPSDRLLLLLERRSQGELDAAAAGVQRLLQHADAAIPTPPLPREALRLDGWPREAVEALIQGPDVVLSRPAGAARAAATDGAVPAAPEQPPPAKQRRLAGRALEGAEAAAWEQQRARVAEECRQAECRLGEAGMRVALAAGAAPQEGGVLVECEWRGSGNMAGLPAGAGAVPEWRRLRLHVGPAYPAEPPTMVFPGKLVAGVDGALAELVKTELFGSLAALPLAASIKAVVGAWAQAVVAATRQQSAQ